MPKQGIFGVIKVAKSEKKPIVALFELVGGVSTIKECGISVSNLYTFAKRGYVTREYYHDFIDYLKTKGVNLEQAQERAILTNKWDGVSIDFKYQANNDVQANKAA